MGTRRLKAIETHYHGYRFRSRLEARWAVFFDALGVKWEYEKEGYDLGKSGWYLPDFWLPDFGCFVEIKGEAPTAKEQEKARALSSASRDSVYVFAGSPGDPAIGIGYYCGDPGRMTLLWQCNDCGRLGFFWDVEPAGVGCTVGVLAHKPVPAKESDRVFAFLMPAITAARSARFEHGERG